MAFCPNCGTPNTEQAEKCVSCGQALTKAGEKPKFKGTIMMTAPQTPDDPKEEQGEGNAPASSGQGQPGQPAQAPAGGGERNLAFQKTVIGGMAAPPPQAPPGQPAAPQQPAAPASPEGPQAPEAGAADAGQDDLGRAQTLAQPAPDLGQPSAEGPSAAATPAGDPQSNAWATAPAAPATGGFEQPAGLGGSKGNTAKILAIGCGALLVLGCLVSAGLFFFAKDEVESTLGAEVDAMEWRMSLTQSLGQIVATCQTDCQNAAVYFHPQVQANMLPEAKSLDTEAVQVLADPTRSEARMLSATGDTEIAEDLGLDLAQCVRVVADAAKVVGCSVPDEEGAASLRIVHMEGVGSL